MDVSVLAKEATTAVISRNISPERATLLAVLRLPAKLIKNGFGNAVKSYILYILYIQQTCFCAN